jgi:hypothetical protein
MDPSPQEQPKLPTAEETVAAATTAKERKEQQVRKQRDEEGLHLLSAGGCGQQRWLRRMAGVGDGGFSGRWRVWASTAASADDHSRRSRGAGGAPPRAEQRGERPPGTSSSSGTSSRAAREFSKVLTIPMASSTVTLEKTKTTVWSGETGVFGRPIPR